MTVFYLISIFFITAALLLYFRLAQRYSITDVPNERSSHSRATIRGGGIVFPLAGLLWFFSCGFSQPWMVAGLFTVAAVSFADDLFTLSVRWRLLAQVVATGLMFFQAGVSGLPWYILVPACIITLGWINGFNFMDGINAITPFYSLAALATFIYLNSLHSFVSPQLPVLLALSAGIFSFFNARKHAVTFAGDVGSVSMAYLLAFMMISLVWQTGRYEYILFFALYAIDTVFTIIYRLLRHENIFKAHRSHLYQWLANELGLPHVLVASIYALVQLAINVVTIALIGKNMMNLPTFLIIVVILSLIYLAIRLMVWKRRFPLARE